MGKCPFYLAYLYYKHRHKWISYSTVALMDFT